MAVIILKFGRKYCLIEKKSNDVVFREPKTSGREGTDMRHKFISKHFLWLVIVLLFACHKGQKYYQCITDKNATDAGSTYTVEIDDVKSIRNPGIIFLARGVDKNEACVLVNGNRYDIPSLPGGASEQTTDENQQAGKAGWYTSSGSDELLGKIVIPLSSAHLQNGLNRIIFEKNQNRDGYKVTDALIASVSEKEAKVAQLTYRAVTRGELPHIEDFDFVVNYKGEGKRKESDLPEWAQRGKVRYYRAGIDFDHLDRLFEMFKEGHFNLVLLQVSTPHDKASEEYKRYKAFIDRCHANGIKVTFDGGASGQSIRLNSISAKSVEDNPRMKEWISKDDYGNLRQRSRGRSYWPDLKNQDYKNEVLKTAEIGIDAGMDELYYDWAIGGTNGIMGFFMDVQNLIARKGKNLTVFGNCKGNILADGVCDIGKSEGTEEAGIWDGRWVHNVVQARFYYAAGDGWKPYRSKYEGADPGVPNPGAHSVVDDMKIGWKRPMAEAKAFQSEFVIAEAGRNLRNGWILMNNPVAMKAWSDICQYNGFFAEHEDLFTDVRTVSRIGLLAPPVIPSFEASVKRVPLYSALAELNLMYDVLLLPRVDEKVLSRYAMIIIPDIPWVEEDQIEALRAYKKSGGKIYTLGSCQELREVAKITSPASFCYQTHEKAVRLEFLNNLRKLYPEPLITLENSEYVITNLVKKAESERVILHLVNYAAPIEDLKVIVNLDGVVNKIKGEDIYILTPDSVLKKLHAISVKGKSVQFTIPRLDIYDIITMN